MKFDLENMLLDYRKLSLRNPESLDVPIIIKDEPTVGHQSVPALIIIKI
ncbi:hypothetical protein N7280_03280 [Rickettsia rhipicephali]|nr:hypothetical protein [Rickettsia rhipicephali]